MSTLAKLKKFGKYLGLAMILYKTYQYFLKQYEELYNETQTDVLGNSASSNSANTNLSSNVQVQTEINPEV